MTDRVEAVHPQHGRHVRKLAHPDPVVRERVGDVVDERPRVLEVVEHRDARDHLRALPGRVPLECLPAEVVVDDVVALGHRIACDVGRVDSHEARTVGEAGVPVEERAVVAADIDDELTRQHASDDVHRLACDAVEVVGHRPVDPAAVPVRAVEEVTGDAVAQLQETARGGIAAGVAADELERELRLGDRRPVRLAEGAGDALVAEVHHVRQRGRAADTARRPGGHPLVRAPVGHRDEGVGPLTRPARMDRPLRTMRRCSSRLVCLSW